MSPFVTIWFLIRKSETAVTPCLVGVVGVVGDERLPPEHVLPDEYSLWSTEGYRISKEAGTMVPCKESEPARDECQNLAYLFGKLRRH